MRSPPFTAWSSVTGWAQAAPEDHLPLLRGLRNRSERTSRDAMTTHVRNVRDLLTDHLSGRGILCDEPGSTRS